MPVFTQKCLAPHLRCLIGLPTQPEKRQRKAGIDESRLFVAGRGRPVQTRQNQNFSLPFIRPTWPGKEQKKR